MGINILDSDLHNNFNTMDKRKEKKAMKKFSIVQISSGRSLGQFRREVVQESANAIYLVQDAEFKSEGVKTHMITEFDKTKYRLDEVDLPIIPDLDEERKVDPYAP